MTRKYIVSLDAPAGWQADQAVAALQALIDRLRAAPPPLAGLIVDTAVTPLTGPNETAGFVQLWTGDQDDSIEPLLSELQSVSGFDPTALFVDEIVLVEPADRLAIEQSPDRINLFGTAYRRDDFTPDAFFDYWRQTHAPISGSVPGLTGYVVSRVASDADSSVPEIDGFIELWWPSVAVYEASADTPQQKAAWEDVPKYAKTIGRFWLTREHVVIPPPATGPGLLQGAG
jgi:uncharacterized protein (TIGR02118 family)